MRHVKDPPEAIEIKLDDLFGICEYCNDSLDHYTEELGVCEICAWEIWAWQQAEGRGSDE